MPLLEIADIQVFYGSVQAIRSVSFQANAGEVVAILGSNGAGKTTTLRTISGLNRTRRGTIMFAGSDITRVAEHEIVSRGLCHVPEGRRIFATLSVNENLSLGAYLIRGQRQETRRRRDRVFDTFPILAERSRQLAGTLSGGEQQMLAIGRALMNEPKALMLDEPSLGLAPIIARRILQIVRALAATGVAVVLVEQNVRQALTVADRAYVLETGSISLEGRAADLATDHRVQRAYLGDFEAIDT